MRETAREGLRERDNRPGGMRTIFPAKRWQAGGAAWGSRGMSTSSATSRPRILHWPRRESKQTSCQRSAARWLKEVLLLKTVPATASWQDSRPAPAGRLSPPAPRTPPPSLPLIVACIRYSQNTYKALQPIQDRSGTPLYERYG